MNNRVSSAAFLLTAALSSVATAEATTKSTTATCLLENPSTADAAVKTAVIFYPPGANEKGKDKAAPFPCDGEWSFTWDSETPDEVAFQGAVHYGDHFIITDAGTLGGVTRQTFYNLTHHLEGTASWDAATRTLHYELPPKDRDDGRASNVEEDKPAICEKVKGFTAGKACAAFEATSLPIEGLKVELTFSSDLSSFEGRAVLTQFGGSGMTKSETPMVLQLTGTLP